MNNNITNKTSKGTVWSMLERFSSIGIQLICTLIIARFVSPDQFGLISMLSIFIALSQVIVDSGFSQALIRDQEATQVDYSSVFFFNILIGITIYIVSFYSAPLISEFYNEPELTRLVRVSFLSLISMSFSVVQQAILLKEFNFSKISKISISSALISGFLGIVTAYYMKNAWALVIQSLSFSVLRTILFWNLSTWKPIIIFEWKSIKKYFLFSINLLGSNLISSITDNLPNLLIGKFQSANNLAYYSIPEKIQRSISGTISFSIHRVSYSAMSQFQQNKEHLLSYSQKVVGIAFFIISPIMLYIGQYSRELILLFLSSDWITSAYYLKYLVIVGMLFCFSDINMDILIIRGKTKLVFLIEVIRKIIFITFLFIGVLNSMKLLLILLIIYQLFNAIFVSSLALRELSANILYTIKAIIPTLYCLLSSFIINLILINLHLTIITSIILGFFVTFIFYIGTAYIINNYYLKFIQLEFKLMVRSRK